MASISLNEMRIYLSKSIRSLDKKLLSTLHARRKFSNYITELSANERFISGGWFVRSRTKGRFGQKSIILFPETVMPDDYYPPDHIFADPDHGFHTVCASFNQIGINCYFCSPTIKVALNPEEIKWSLIQTGMPTRQIFRQFPFEIAEFRKAKRINTLLSQKTNVSELQDQFIPDLFSKENLRAVFQKEYASEFSDLFGVIWGNQYIYPVEVFEKTLGKDSYYGYYFDINIKSILKSAFFATRQGVPHYLFIVREIDNPKTKNLKNWWYITFENFIQFASWIPKNTVGIKSENATTTVAIPKTEFREFDKKALEEI